MIQKQIAFFAVILALLGAFYYFYEICWKGKEAAVIDNSRKLFNLDKGIVEGLRIRNSRTTLMLKKEGADWVLTEPFNAKGKGAVVKSILDIIMSERWVDELGLRQGMLFDFGLAPPAIEIGLQGKGLQKERGIHVGSKSPTGRFLYVRIDSEPRILMVRSCFKNLLNRSISDLAEERYDNRTN